MKLQPQFFIILFSLLITLSMNSYSQYEQKTHPENGNNMLIGDLKIENLLNEVGFEDLSKEIPFEGDANQLAALVEQLKNVEITIYIGTWCSDSQVLFPQIISLLKTVKYDIDKLKIIGLDNEKKGINNIEQMHDILYVPTIIFIRDNQEIGRIVEMPSVDLLTDFVNIVL